jgi:hypothetical protein
MTSTSDIQEAISMLLSCGVPFVLMVEDRPGGLSYYSNNKGDRLFIVDQEEN